MAGTGPTPDNVLAIHLDVPNQSLWRGDRQLALTPKAFAMLRYLIAHRGELVTKEALRKAAWESTHTAEGRVKQFISELRAILRDDPKAPRFIETVRGRGYRFIGNVELRGEPGVAAPSESPPHIEVAGTQEAAVGTLRTKPRPNPSNRPAIAVLPLRNLSGDPADDYFGEGITEDIISGFARSQALFVIARHSTLPYRHRHADAKQIAADLGVRYIVDGSVRRHTTRLRIATELVDADQNRTIWAQKYDGTSEDLFKFQDRIASSIVATIEPRLYEAEIARVHNKPPDNIDAYDYVLRAMALFYTFHDQEFSRVGHYLDRAVEIDPNYAQAYAYKAWWYVLRIGEARSSDRDEDAGLAEAAARKAVQLDSKDAFALAVAAHVESFVRQRPEYAVEMYERSLELNACSPFAWAFSALNQCYLGRAEDALARLENVWRLSPFDPLNYFFFTIAGIAEFLRRRYERAIVWLQKSRAHNSRLVGCHRTLAAAYWYAGRETDARAATRDLLALDPKFRISTFVSRYPLRSQEDLARLVAPLRAMGVPE